MVKRKKEKKHVLIGVNVIRREIIQRCHFKGLQLRAHNVNT